MRRSHLRLTSRDADKGLNGGVSLGWRSDTKEVTASVFVGQMVSWPSESSVQAAAETFPFRPINERCRRFVGHEAWEDRTFFEKAILLPLRTPATTGNSKRGPARRRNASFPIGAPRKYITPIPRPKKQKQEQRDLFFDEGKGISTEGRSSHS